MSRKTVLKTALWGFFLILLGSGSDAWAMAQTQHPNTPFYKPGVRTNRATRRFGYIPVPANILPGTQKKQVKCVAHGQARCLGSVGGPARFQNRYIRPTPKTQFIHPALRARSGVYKPPAY